MEKKPFCISLREGLIITIFNNELDEIHDYAIEGDNSLWYLLGTDIWLELQERNEKMFIVARNYNKTYFECFINDEIFKSIKVYEECGIVVMSSSKEFEEQDLLTDLSFDSTEDDLVEWANNKIENDLNMFICCYYTKEARKKYHDSDYIA
ncbi:hypothetical protein [Flavobacterium sp. 22076]|uniref:hypothetical protein n=1 Tax=unclassified Flavobacterium TaxID=196869 RepID=UPI003F82EDF3